MKYGLTRRELLSGAQKAALATPFLTLVGCGDPSDEVVSLSGQTMGTTYTVKLVEPPAGLDQAGAAAAIDGLLSAVDRQMSTYRPDSELSAINRAAAGRETVVSKDTYTVIDAALRVSRLSAGAFEPSVGPVVDLWGFGPGDGAPRVPQKAHIAAKRAAVGHHLVATDEGQQTVRKARADLRLDLSGVAKGFAVDQVSRYLSSQGLTNHLVEVGGELRASGVGPEGRPWRVGIEKPSPLPGDILQVVDLKQAALATSGNYRFFFEQGARRYSHIIDPVTGYPVDHALASATVVAATTMEADALSTALLVMGPERGMDFATEHGIAAFFVTADGETWVESASPAFEKRQAA